MMGMAATTKIITKQIEPGHWEARQGFSLMGNCNMPDHDIEMCGYDPFHPEWHDNFHSGKGDSEQAAIEALKQSATETGEAFWA